MPKTVAEHMQARTLTLAEFRAEAAARFGPDPLGWAFECPRCGDVATGADFRGALAAAVVPRQHPDGTPVVFTDVFGQECVGRAAGFLGALASDPDRGCNWAAYGLIPGPWAVLRPDGSEAISCFPLALDVPPVIDDEDA